MAEIKSTLEKVMEKVAGMGYASREEIKADEDYKEGMRLGADYLQGRIEAIAPAIRQPAAGRSPRGATSPLLKGLADVLLRNIVLPRNDVEAIIDKAMQGLKEINEGNRDLLAIFADIKKIIGRYQQHKKELHQQLESSFRHQIELALAQQPRQSAAPLKIEPTLHPKFQEEWLRITDELNQQYGRALDQHKDMVRQLMAL